MFVSIVGLLMYFSATTIIESHSRHKTSNNNGLRLIDLATGKGITVKSTCFMHKAIPKRTWRSANGRHVNQIDHILVNLRFSNSIQKPLRADCD